MQSQLHITNSIYGIKTIAQEKCSEITLSSKRIGTMKMLPGDDVVSFVLGNGINDNTKYYIGLTKSIQNGISLLQAANNGLNRILNLLTTQKSLVAIASGKNQASVDVLNSTFKMNERKINNIVSTTRFGNSKILDGTFGIDSTRSIKYPYEVNSVSIATKSPPVGQLVFLRDNIAFQPFESSAATVTINNVSDGDNIYIEGQKFTFRNNPDPSMPSEMQLQATDEENARRLVTTILNANHSELKRYAATNIGAGMISIQSQIRSGKAANVNSICPSIIVDNITPQADSNVLDLDNLIDNNDFYGKITPNFKLDAPPVYDAAARNLAIINDIDLDGYAGDAGDSAAKYTCKIGSKYYEGVIFLRGFGGLALSMDMAPNASEKLFLVMREVNNTDSSFTINFDSTYDGILDSPANAEIFKDKLNDLFARLSFKQNRYIAVNEIPDFKALKLFDPKTTTATITNTDFDNLRIDNFKIYNISPTLVEFRLTINGVEYSDSTVSRTLREGDRISMEYDSTNFVALTIGEGGLDLTNPAHFEDIQHAFLTFFTNQANYHEVQVTKNNFENISTKISNFGIEELFKDSNSDEYIELNILDNLARRKAAIILDRATNLVISQIAIIQNSINAIQSEMARILHTIDLSNESFGSYTNVDLVTVCSSFSKNLKELQALISTQTASRMIDAGAQQLILGLSENIDILDVDENSKIFAKK